MTDGTAASVPRDQGLQAERTALSWTRTSFAALANGALLAIRELHGSPGPTGLIPPVLAVIVALCTYLVALQRQRTLSRRPLPRRITARHPVHLVGAAILLLVLVTAIALPM
jgi:uncharacterized membrane protein YidH (DUF202 family)